MNIAQLQKTLKDLIANQTDDLRLRDNLEGLQREPNLGVLTWYWGPILYARNRVMFRSFIQQHFGTGGWEGYKWIRVGWSEHQAQLEQWLQIARKNHDTALVKRMNDWKFADNARWGIDAEKWRAELLSAYRSTSEPAARAIILLEYDQSAALDEPTALQLYSIDRSCGPFIIRHLNASFWDDSSRKFWKNLFDALGRNGDSKLQFTLYRKQIPITDWATDAINLANQVQNEEALNDELTKRHPEGYWLDLTATFVKLLEMRGRSVMPYVRGKLSEVFGGWGKKIDSIIKLSSERGWWDLWAATIRICTDNKEFIKAVQKLLSPIPIISEKERVSRFEALSGVSREWNWPGFGLAVVHHLDDATATELYARYPQLIHGPYRQHVTPTWWGGFPKLLQAAMQRRDEDLIDLLASRYITRAQYDHSWYNKSSQKEMFSTVEELAEYYQNLRSRDPDAFSRRAATLLTRIPAFAINNYYQVLRTNPLARLMFVRSFESLLAHPDAVQDLIEASDIHVQMLAYRVLAQNDERARKIAANNLHILCGTLLRPLHRKTRMAAFDALANAAKYNLESASVILKRSRDALRLPDKKYPKEELVGLIAVILHSHESLRSVDEQPRIYRRVERVT